VRYDLAAMTRRSLSGRKPRKPTITLRPILPTAVMAGDLYRAGYEPVISAWRRAVETIGKRYEAALPPVNRLGDIAKEIGRERQFSANDEVRIHPKEITLSDAVFDLDSILAAIEGSLQQLVISITPQLREWSVRAEGWHRGKWRGAVLAGTGIDPKTMLGAGDVAETVNAFVSRNVALVRSVSDETRSRISDIVLRGYASRTPLRTVAKEMDDAVDLGRKRALRIASDQNAKLAAGLDAARQQQAGITEFAWHHSFKKHPRRWHQTRDGKVYVAATGDQVGGGDHVDPGDYPGEPPFCGCRRRAVIDLS
jgi:hypothetical protein